MSPDVRDVAFARAIARLFLAVAGFTVFGISLSPDLSDSVCERMTGAGWFIGGEACVLSASTPGATPADD